MRRCGMLMLMLLLSALALPAWSQHAPKTGDTSVPTPWGSLDPDAQQMLAPLQSKWPHMSPRHQQHLVDKAKHWENLPESRRRAIRERIQRWQNMTPVERQRARANRRVYHHMPQHERQQLHDAYQRFQRLPPEQRERVLRQWHEMDVKQRRRWIDQHPQPHHAPRHPPQATGGDQ